MATKDKVFIVGVYPRVEALEKSLRDKGFDVEVVAPAAASLSTNHMMATRELLRAVPPVVVLPDEPRRPLTTREKAADLNAHFNDVREKHHPQDTFDLDEGEEP